ncbi:Phosphate regulon transcriptional regulatory protein PhoB (SphR) [Imhoffiella purpurea]|uniref:Phosphate regulon transcriptional regulatory protein PhoB (SphR) n=2 Tax=Imhoffiella purpurea TaxID=1249627 RepID=W9VWC1_9GAMM|nr:Phosphate regulon transcriptional regulatory protein PhoB (SphR) [Imhoffiella purpurea]
MVALCGFSDSERKVLGRAFGLSQIRPQRYLLWEPGSQPPQLCMVNEDQASGREDWAALLRTMNVRSPPVVRVGVSDSRTAEYEGAPQIFFKRPVLASRVLKTLDELVNEAYHFAPDLTIHDDMLVTRDAVGDGSQVAVSGGTKRVLVVDDSESVRKVMELQLTKKGYAVDFAVSGEECLTKVRRQLYDLIFLDVMLPGINGYDVARHLKRDFRVLSPVVMLTSKSSRLDKLKGTLASADAYLTKPLTIRCLEETLQRFLA